MNISSVKVDDYITRYNLYDDDSSVITSLTIEDCRKVAKDGEVVGSFIVGLDETGCFSYPTDVVKMTDEVTRAFEQAAFERLIGLDNVEKLRKISQDKSPRAIEFNIGESGFGISCSNGKFWLKYAGLKGHFPYKDFNACLTEGLRSLQHNVLNDAGYVQTSAKLGCDLYQAYPFLDNAR
ncbi:MAG: hypothetical protein F6J93_27725 [Oscillatoria sp. SIO1A7]|nr:hypothetical protein [Oscillatoria sp. SIO1A7]